MKTREQANEECDYFVEKNAKYIDELMKELQDKEVLVGQCGILMTHLLCHFISSVSGDLETQLSFLNYITAQAADTLKTTDSAFNKAIH